MTRLFFFIDRSQGLYYNETDETSYKLRKGGMPMTEANRNEKLYIQVSDNISDKKTFERETAPLLGIKDAYPKMLIARTNHETTQYEGIRIVDVSRWLLGMD